MYDNDEFIIKSNQPYIALETSNFSQNFVNNKGISHFYSFQNNDTSTKTISLVADACTNIIFSYTTNNTTLKNAWAFGSNLKQHSFEIEPETIYFGVRFQPGENPCFNNTQIKSYNENIFELNQFEQMKSYIDIMSIKKDFSSFISLYMGEHLKTYDKDTSFKHKLYRQFIRLIVSKKGILKISELVSLTGYSARYINQIFEDVSGMSAKHFCNNVKLQNIIEDIHTDKFESLAKLSSEYKFYDMAHFIHEFKAFTGKTPGEYINLIKANDYLNKITIFQY